LGQSDQVTSFPPSITDNVRSVVMQPYTLVKDHRSGWETSNVDGLLGGSQLLTDAIESYFLYCASQQL
jgi:protein subunit release factor B